MTIEESQQNSELLKDHGNFSENQIKNFSAEFGDWTRYEGCPSLVSKSPSKRKTPQKRSWQTTKLGKLLSFWIKFIYQL